MLRYAKGLLALIGLAAVCFSFLRIAVPAPFRSRSEQLRIAFGTPEAIKDLDQLYHRVESSPQDPQLGEVYEWSDATTFRRIPYSWLPPRFRNWTGAVDTGEILLPGTVTAHYSAAHLLTSIRFFGRRDLIVSREPPLLPSRFREVHRLAEGPLFVTAIVWTHDDY